MRNIFIKENYLLFLFFFLLGFTVGIIFFFLPKDWNNEPSKSPQSKDVKVLQVVSIHGKNCVVYADTVQSHPTASIVCPDSTEGSTSAK
jgi:hypothetical protein